MKNIRRLFWCLLFIVVPLSGGTARERYTFSNLSLEDGLSQITVICIHQDSQGFMWFGTRNGLNRYDGYSFDVFLSDPEDPFSISDNHILAMEETPGGEIWVGTNRGLNRYDPRQDRFHTYYHDPADGGSLSHDIILSLRFDNAGRLWIGTLNGLNLYDPVSDSFVRHDLDGLFDDNPIYDILPHGDKLYIGTMLTGLVIYDTASRGYEVLRHDPNDPSGIGHDYVRAVFIDKDDNLWVGSHHNGVSVKLKGRDGFVTINSSSGLTNDYVRTIAQNPQGDILVGTFNGLNVIDPVTFAVEQYGTFSAGQGNLSHYSIYSIYIDRAQTIWVGSYGGGVDYYNPYGQKFRFYDPRQAEKSMLGLLGPVVETGDHLYIASEGSGIMEFEKSTGQFRNYNIFRNVQYSYARNIVKTLYLDGDRILCSTNHGVIYSFDLRTKTYTLVYDTGMEDPIYYLGRNSSGELMAGGVNDPVGLLMISPGGRVTDRFPVEGRVDVQFPNVRCVLEIEPERFLIGSRNDGLFDYDRGRATLRQYRHDPHSDKGIPENYVSNITRDSAGRIWVGTFGGGLSAFDPDTGIFTTWSTREGLANNNVCALVEDVYGHLWVSTISGISDFDPSAGEFINYRHNNGVQVNEFTPHAGTLLSNGNIIFCGNNGMIMFDPGFMYNNPFVPQIVLRSLNIDNILVSPNDGTGVLQQELNSQGQITLKHDQSNFSIEFSSLNYIFPERNQYAYMLEGFDAGWNEVGSRRIAYYTNIPPGKYRFVVRGSNNDRIWNNDGRAVDIIVLPPFWRTWWAYTLYALAALGMAWLVMRYFSTRKRLENDIKLKQAEAKAQAEFHEARDKLFTNFSHELRTPLTLIMSPLDDLIEKQGESLGGKISGSLQLMQGNARRLLRLVNNLMDFQKREHGRLELNVAEGDFAGFAREMTGAFDEVAHSRGITLAIECTEEHIPYCFDRNLMEKVFFNYLSNAFKNVPDGGRVSVRVSLLDKERLPAKAAGFHDGTIQYILLEIGDSGEGIPQEELEKIFVPFYQVAQNEHSASGTGLGLSLSRSIIEMHHGVIWAESPEGSGALFRTVLPVDRSLYPEVGSGPGTAAKAGQKVDSEARHGRMDTSGAEEPGSGRKYTILVVEDNIDIRKYIVSHLCSRYHIMEAGNGSDAVDKAVNHLPDLIITDRMMPKMDGMEMVGILKEDIRTSHIPIIVITARTMVDDIREGYRKGADDYITKPFNASILVDRVANLIDSREKLKALYGKRFSLESMGIEATSLDERFMNKLYAILEANMSNPEFGLDQVCHEVGMSRANLYRKIKAITDVSPNNFIRNFRLEMGAKMLKDARLSVSDVYVAVGFSSHAYFSNCFKSLYGVSPTEYASGSEEGKTGV